MILTVTDATEFAPTMGNKKCTIKLCIDQRI